MSAYYMRRSTYQKDYNEKLGFPPDAMEGKSKFFPYPGRENTRHRELGNYYNSLERFEEKDLQRRRNETSFQYEDRLKHLRLSDDTRNMGHHQGNQHRPNYYSENRDRYFDHHNREPFSDRSPRPQHHDNDRLRRSYEKQDMDMRKEEEDIYYNRGNLTYRRNPTARVPEVRHQENRTPRMNYQEHSSPRMHPEEHISPRIQPQEYNSPRTHQPEHNRQRIHHQENATPRMPNQEQISPRIQHQDLNSQRDTRVRIKSGVYLISRIPKRDNSLRDMKHYFQRNYRYVSTAGGELLGIPDQILLKYGGTLGFPDWKDNNYGEAANVIAVLWFPNFQAANAWATSGPLLKSDHLLDSTTNSLAIFPINYRPRKDSYPTYLMLELRTKRIRGSGAMEDFRQMIIDRMNSVFKQYPTDWCSPFVVSTFVDYAEQPELQLLEKWMDKTFVFLHNFQNKSDATKFLDQFLDNTYDLLIGPHVATIFDLK